MKVAQNIVPGEGQSLSKKASFSQVLAMPSYQKMLETAIQDPNRRQRFITTIISTVNTTPKLKECKPDSIITAALQMEALGLTTGLGDAYIIPYGDVAQFQMGARGYVQLAMRSGQYLDIDTIEVRQGEYKGRDKMTGKPIFEFIEDDDIRENLPIVGYLAYFTLLNGFHAQEYFSDAKMMAWADRYSQSFSKALYEKFIGGEALTDKEARMVSSPWFSNYESMAAKTVLKRLLSKKGVLSIEMVEAFKHDTKDGTTDGMFEMNIVSDEDVPNESEEPKEEVVPTVQTPKRGRPPKSETTSAVSVENSDGANVSYTRSNGDVPATPLNKTAQPQILEFDGDF